MKKKVNISGRHSYLLELIKRLDSLSSKSNPPMLYPEVNSEKEIKDDHRITKEL